MSDLTVALAGGAIGSVVTVMVGQLGRAQVGWSEVALHDQQATERNEQLIAYVIDDTRKLVRELESVAEDYNSRGALHSSKCVGDLADRKADALHSSTDTEIRSGMSAFSSRT